MAVEDTVITHDPKGVLEILQEAARRANWDAQHGPQHLRTGRFFISALFAPHAFVEPSLQGPVAARVKQALLLLMGFLFGFGVCAAAFEFGCRCG